MTTPVPPQEVPPAAKSRTGARLKFLLIMLIAFALGYVSTLLPLKSEEPPGFRFPGPFRFSADPLLQFHTFITTVDIVLLIALLGVYVQVYSDTRARFSLGLVGVLAALLLDTILSYPLVEGTIGPIGLEPGGLLPFADLLEVAAYILFLYLSLE